MQVDNRHAIAEHGAPEELGCSQTVWRLVPGIPSESNRGEWDGHPVTVAHGYNLSEEHDVGAREWALAREGWSTLVRLETVIESVTPYRST